MDENRKKMEMIDQIGGENLAAILEAIILVAQRGSGYGAVVIKIEQAQIKEITSQSSIRPPVKDKEK